MEQSERPDLRMVERLLGLEHRAGRNVRRGQRLQRLVTGPPGAPGRHALRQDRAVVPARVVGGEAFVLKPFRLAQQIGPALEQRVADDMDHDEAVFRLEQVGRAGIEGAVTDRPAVRRQDGLLRQQGRVEGGGGREQRADDLLPAAGALLLD